MDIIRQTELLNLLDLERQTVMYPGVTRFSGVGIVKDVSADGKSAEIVYSSCSENTVDSVIEQEKRAAQNAGYALEWKFYGHDQPHNLSERLTVAGFEADDREAFLVFPHRGHHNFAHHFAVPTADIRRVTSANGLLRDYQIVREEVKGVSCENDIRNYAFMLENHPNHLSVYVAYVDGEPAACGRISFHPDSAFAGLAGGQTRERFRKRGLFTQIVAVRIREAIERGVSFVCVDALPTSEPILRKRGFEVVTETQPFHFVG